MDLSSDQFALQQRAREFSRAVAQPRAAQIDSSGEYPWDIVAALQKAGFLGMTIPQSYGGQGRSFLDAVLAIEQMAMSCTVTARIVVETNMGAISAVMTYGSEAQKKLAASLVLSGDKPAICITEPEAGSDAGAMTTRADKRGNHYIINGRKHWITGAGVSRLHLIFARVFDESGDEQGIGGFIAVREQAKGLRVVKRERTMGLCGMPEGELAFEDLHIPNDMALIPPSSFRRGFAELMNAYNSQRVGAGTVAMGIAAGALLCFIPIMGEFVIPDLLGSSQSLMVGQTLWTEFFSNRDWPVASAIAVTLLIALLGPILIYERLQRRAIEGES